jgi:AcrR family transcriptional regulator
MGQRHYDDIAVADITGRADVGRSTFYSHFDSKDALLFANFEPWILSLTEGPHPARDSDAGATDGHFGFSLPLLRHVRSAERFFRSVIAGPRANPQVRHRAIEAVAAAVRVELKGRRERGRVGIENEEGGAGSASGLPGESVIGLARAVAAGFFAIAEWWLNGARHLDAEEVDQVFQELWRLGAEPGPTPPDPGVR